jgi:hypothetical protein
VEMKAEITVNALVKVMLSISNANGRPAFGRGTIEAWRHYGIIRQDGQSALPAIAPDVRGTIPYGNGSYWESTTAGMVRK